MRRTRLIDPPRRFETIVTILGVAIYAAVFVAVLWAGWSVLATRAGAAERTYDVPSACARLARLVGLPSKVQRAQIDEALARLSSAPETNEVRACRDAILAMLKRR